MKKLLHATGHLFSSGLAVLWKLTKKLLHPLAPYRWFILAGLVISAGVAWSLHTPPDRFVRRPWNPNRIVAELPEAQLSLALHTGGSPKVVMQRGGSSLEFTLPSSPAVLSKVSDNQVHFSLNTKSELIYTLLSNGIKEDIKLFEAPESNTFNTQIRVNKLLFNRSPGGQPVFYDETGEYQFHFLPAYAEDASGNRTYALRYRLLDSNGNPLPDKQEDLLSPTPLEEQESYQVALEVDESWLRDPARTYPILIDPTVVHDTSSEFATGTHNRTLDAGYAALPSIESWFKKPFADTRTVGYWNFDVTNSITEQDLSGRGNHGTYNGTTPALGVSTMTGFTVNPQGNARDFDGVDDYIDLGTGVRFSRAFTISAWVNLDSITIAEYARPFVAKGNWGSDAAGDVDFGLVTPGLTPTGNGTLGLTVHTNSGRTTVRRTAATLPFGRWMHVAASYDGENTVRLYEDGRLTHTQIIAGVLSNSTRSTYIGAFPNNVSDSSVDGRIDEVRILNVALSDEEIAALANRYPSAKYTSEAIDLADTASLTDLSWETEGLATGDGETPLDTTGLVGTWNLNETSGTTATNTGSCGAGCNGTLTNFHNTSGQDVASSSGWTNTYRRWGTGGLRFDGINDHISIPDDNVFTPTSSGFTVSTWAYFSQLTTNSTTWLATKADTSNFEWGMGLNPTTGTLFCTAWTNDGSGTVLTVATRHRPSTGEWHHIVCSFDPTSRMQVFLDGVMIGESTSVSSSVTNGTAPVTLGKRQDGNGNHFKGILDAVSIYTRQLDLDEVRSLYNSSLLQFQTRTGNTTDPNDGTWEAWAPNSNETSWLPMDTFDPSWGPNYFDGEIVGEDSVIKQEGDESARFTLTTYPSAFSSGWGRWSMEETSGTSAYIRDTSTTGTAHGTPTGTTSVVGIVGNARFFNGSSDHIDMGDVLDQTGSYTLEAWIYPTGTSGRIINKDTGSQGWALSLGDPGAGRLRFFDRQLSTVSLDSSTVLETNRWYHVAAVRDASGNTKRIYINGKLDASATSITGSSVNNTAPLRIGNASSTTSRFSGIIDEVQIKPYAATASEMEMSYNLGTQRYISTTVSDIDLSGITALPFRIAANRPGSYLEFTVGTPFTNGLPDSDTTSFWRFDVTTPENLGGTLYRDEISHAALTALSGSPVATKGRFGNATHLDGSGNGSYVSQNSNGFNSSSAFTASAWIRPTSLPTTEPASIFQVGSSSGTMWQIGIDASGKLYCVLWQTYSSVAYLRVNSDITPELNSWQHVACSMEVGTPGEMHFYHNGLEIGSQTANASFNSAQNAYVGYEPPSHEAYAGQIDEVRIDEVVRTPEQIRDLVQIDRRTYPITIDFAARIEVGENIADSSDLTFEISDYDGTAVDNTDPAKIIDDSTSFRNLSLGDMIVVRENVDGTFYIAQGVVSGISTVSNEITVESWIGSSTFPSGGFTRGAEIFKWQEEFWNISNAVLPEALSTANSLVIRPTTGSEGRIIWLDDMRTATDYLATPLSSLPASTENQYGQYRTLFMNNDNTTTRLTEVSLEYQYGPPAPSFESAYLHNKLLTPDTTPEIRFSTSDTESDDLVYEVEWDTDAAFSSSTTVSSDADAGFSNIDNGGDTSPFTSGDIIRYTWQSALSNATTYFYRVRATDPSGSDLFGDWSEVRSFTVNTSALPSWFETHADQFATDTLGGNAQVNAGNDSVEVTSSTGTVLSTPITIADISPLGVWSSVSANTDETNGSILFRIYYDNSGTPTIVPDGDLPGNSTGFNSTPISLATLSTTTYPTLYLHATLTHSGGSPELLDWGFNMNIPPNTPSLDSPADTSTVYNFTPTLQTTATDDDGDNLQYRIQLCMNALMTQSCVLFDQTDSQTGWSGQDADTSTTYTSGTQASYTIQANLIPGGTYYWRSWAIDPAGSGSWSETQGTPFSFSIPNLQIHLQCLASETPDDESITITWNDPNAVEDGYEIERSVNGGGFSAFDDLAANTTSTTDSSVSPNNSYQYRVRATVSSLETEWCTTPLLNLFTGNLQMEGVRGEGIRVD